MKSYYTKSKKRYNLGEKLGAGGEGTVYRIVQDSTLAAKIFHAGTKDMDEMRRKLETMISMPIQPVIDGLLHIAWPIDILYDGSDFAGYVMPLVTAPHKIFEIYRDDPGRDKILPEYTWKFSVQYAYNLSWLVWYMHMNDIVIGDMNMKNIHIDNTGCVVLIDCDSFDITNPKTKEHFPCRVGLPEMLAPELQTVGSLSNGRFSKESDNFSLAIHIFRLLMKNADPFGAKLISKKKSSKSMVNASAAIVNGECVYARKVAGKEAPDWVPPFELLPKEIQNAFKNTFNYTALTALANIKNRTTAEQWNRLLLPLAQKGNNPHLKTCANNPRHIYPAHNTRCPWCGANENTLHNTDFMKRIRNMIGY